MTKPIYVIGHKNPDTDSICAAIAYSNLKRALGFEAQPYRAGELNKETEYVLDHFNVEHPQFLADLHTMAKDFVPEKVILVDHNELGQAVDGVEEAKIEEVIDHHRIGGITTAEPILFRNEPLGCTCTIVAKAYFEQGIDPSREMAGIMCAAILSDTVVFKSPTCTAVDRDIAAKLAEIADIDPVEFGTAMFEATSSLSGRTAAEILQTDYKEFTLGGVRIGVGQVTVMGTAGVAELKPRLLDQMENLRLDSGLQYVLLMITDLLAEATHLLVGGDEPEQIGAAFKATVEDRTIFLPGVLSRKKQVIPPLTTYFN